MPLEKSPAEAGLRQGATTEIPSLTDGLAGLRTTVCFKLLSRMNKADRVVGQRTATEQNFPCRPEFRAAA